MNVFPDEHNNSIEHLYLRNMDPMNITQMKEFEQLRLDLGDDVN